jgi:hypothetical protein
MNAFDASYFESSISDTEAQIAYPRRDVSVPDFAILRATCHYLANLAWAFPPSQLEFTVVGYQ